MKKLLFYLFLFPFFAYSQYGVLDESFGEGGIYSTQVPDDLANNLNTTSLITDQNQNIYVIGNFQLTLNQNGFFIAKFSQNGLLDTTFGEMGYKRFIVNEGSINANDIIFTNDNMLAIVGNFKTFEQQDISQIYVMKLDLAGNLLNSFGEEGVCFFAPQESETGYMLAQDNVGNYYIGANSGNLGSNYLISKLNQSGILDINFGSNGKVYKDVGSEDYPTQLKIAGDYLYLLGVSTMFEPSPLLDHDICVLKYSLDGASDDSFGENGIVLTSYDNSDIDAFCLEFGQNGGFYIGGTIMREGGNEDFFVTKYSENGSIDLTFGENGISQFDLGGTDYPVVGIHIMGSNNIILTGNKYTAQTEIGFQFAFISIDSIGNLNQNVGEDGFVITDIVEGKSDRAFKSIKYGNDKIIMMGKSGNNRISLARYFTGENLKVYDNSQYNSIQIIPNPTSNSFVINGLKGNNNQIKIFDLTGKLINEFKSVHENQKIELGAISKGIYLVKIYSEGKTESKKLIVK